MSRTWRPIDDVFREADDRSRAAFEAAHPSELPTLSPAALRGRLRRGWNPASARVVLQGFVQGRVRTRHRRVLRLLRAAGPLTRDQVAHRVGCTRAQAWHSLDHLRGRGLVEVRRAGGLSVWTATRPK